jgi:histidyl-tRNA synthetase
MSAGPLPGFRDFYPAELAERAHIFATWRAVARRYAFVEVDGPPLESTELYTKKSGDEIVGQLYNFADKGGRDVALRPEMTPTVARMVAARAQTLRKPVRWFSIAQMFRYERKQRGRLREHFQLNMDIFGEPDVAADAELLACAIDIVRAFGLTPEDVRARVSDRRLLAALLTHAGVPDAALPAVYAAIDKIERDPAAATAERLAKAGLGPDVIERVMSLAHPTTVDELASRYAHVPAIVEAVERLRRYFAHLAALGVDGWARLDLSIVRGLAYYTGIVFELFDAKGELRAICGGGRYDTLLNTLGGVDLPAVGFAMGDVVLGELLKARGLMNAPVEEIDVWVAAEDDVPIDRVMQEAARLRAAGKTVEYALRPQSLSKQKHAARAAGAREIITLTK